MKQQTILGSMFTACAMIAWSQADGNIQIIKGDRPTIAIPDLRGSGDAAKFMDKFNETLWNEIENSGVVKMAAKSMYPLKVPQQPTDFKQPANETENMGGLWLADWGKPPVSANYLAMGFTAVAADKKTAPHISFTPIRSGNFNAANDPSKHAIATRTIANLSGVSGSRRA